MKVLVAAVIIIGLSAVIGAIVVSKNASIKVVVDSPYYDYDEIQRQKVAPSLDVNIKTDDKLNCDMDKGACTVKVGSMEITLNITPKPVRAMEELTFTVALKNGGKHEKLIIDLSMPSMFMGKNQVILKRTADGKYVGKGVIPRCPGGGTLWQATVKILETEEVEFLFHVKY